MYLPNGIAVTYKHNHHTGRCILRLQIFYVGNHVILSSSYAGKAAQAGNVTKFVA